MSKLCECSGDQYCPLCANETTSMTIRVKKEMKVRLGRTFDQSMTSASRNGCFLSLFNMTLSYFETGELQVFRPLSTWIRNPELSAAPLTKPTLSDWDAYMVKVAHKPE